MKSLVVPITCVTVPYHTENENYFVNKNKFYFVSRKLKCSKLVIDYTTVAQKKRFILAPHQSLRTRSVVESECLHLDLVILYQF